jgi:hypothetical protein
MGAQWEVMKWWVGVTHGMDSFWISSWSSATDHWNLAMVRPPVIGGCLEAVSVWHSIPELPYHGVTPMMQSGIDSSNPVFVQALHYLLMWQVQHIDLPWAFTSSSSIVQGVAGHRI